MYSIKQKNFFILTFAVKITFLIVLFVGVPYVLISVSRKYERKAEGIIEQQNTLVSIQSDSIKEMKVLTQTEADTLSQISDFISGTWISEYDGKYRIEISPNNKFEEFYDNKKEGFGVWRVFSGVKEDIKLSPSPDLIGEGALASSGMLGDTTAFSSTSPNGFVPSAYTKDQYESTKIDEPKYFFQKQQYEPDHKGEIYIYQIQQLDSEKFVLVFKSGSGKPLVFLKVNSVESVF